MRKEIITPYVIGVYIRINEKNEIIEIDSDIFIKEKSGWIKIDEGFGKKYIHAQGAYLDKPITDDYGKYNYKYENGAIIEVDHEDITELLHKNELRAVRSAILKAFDIYKTNVEYGIEIETETEHAQYIAWYKGLLELEESSVFNVPERIRRYL